MSEDSVKKVTPRSCSLALKETRQSDTVPARSPRRTCWSRVTAGPPRVVTAQCPTMVGDGVDRALVVHPRSRSSLCLPLRCRCDHCHKGFKKSSHLKQHVRSHTGEKPYKCELCGRGFVSSGVLKAHEKTHTGRYLPCPGVLLAVLAGRVPAPLPMLGCFHHAQRELRALRAQPQAATRLLSVSRVSLWTFYGDGVLQPVPLPLEPVTLVFRLILAVVGVVSFPPCRPAVLRCSPLALLGREGFRLGQLA